MPILRYVFGQFLDLLICLSRALLCVFLFHRSTGAEANGYFSDYLKETNKNKIHPTILPSVTKSTL